VTTEPSTITVVGPESRVKAATMAITDPIDVSDVRGAATFGTNAYVADALVREIKPEQIRVTVMTGQIPGEGSNPSAHNHR
jgi:YbbR domain-containing protein